MRLRLIRPDTQLGFMRWHKLAFALSFAALILSVVLLTTRGLNFGIDFTGGLVMEIRLSEPVALGELRQAVGAVAPGDASLQHFGSDLDVMVRMQLPEGVDQSALVADVKTALEGAAGAVEYRKVDAVGPQVGRELVQAGLTALMLSFGAMLLYIWFRFEWQFGLGAIVALIHDSILALGFMALLGLEFNLASIAAILTIIGYSINDSVVIYDRVRENLRRFKKLALTSLLDKSINETLSRTLLTAGTTIMALIALSVFGGEVIRNFSLVILFGVVIGTYSSIFVAAPLLRFFDPRVLGESAGGASSENASA